MNKVRLGLWSESSKGLKEPTYIILMSKPLGECSNSVDLKQTGSKDIKWIKVIRGGI